MRLDRQTAAAVVLEEENSVVVNAEITRSDRGVKRPPLIGR